MTRYIKAYIALIGGLTTWAITYFPENVDLQRALGLLAALGTAAAVFQFKNTPPAGQPSDPGVSEVDVPVNEGGDHA